MMKINLTNDIESLDMGDKISNSLKRNGIYTIEDILQLNADQLIKLKGIGNKIANTISETIAQNYSLDDLKSFKKQLRQHKYEQEQSLSFKNAMQIKKIKKDLATLMYEMHSINKKLDNLLINNKI